MCTLVACSSSADTSTGGTTPTPQGTNAVGGNPQSGIPTSIVGTSIPSTPGTGPIVILSTTPVPGGSPNSQQVVLADRTLIISNMSKGAGADASSVAVSLTMTLKNTSSKAIPNEVSYYSLIGAEGDTFGLPATTTNSFFGTIAANGSHSGTVVFQVPASAAKGLRLLYRPDVVTETVFVPINV